jgi:hypothetical protein
MWLSGFYHIFW